MSQSDFNLKELSKEVFVSEASIVNVSKEITDFLKTRAKQNKKKKCRLLLHQNSDESLHEMLIVHTKGQYIRPHINIGRSKSWHVIEGALVCVLFTENGDVADHWTIGDYNLKECYMTRLSDKYYHTLVPMTDTVTFIETTIGPWKETTYASWSPNETDHIQAQIYFHKLCQSIGIDL